MDFEQRIDKYLNLIDEDAIPQQKYTAIIQEIKFVFNPVQQRLQQYQALE